MKAKIRGTLVKVRSWYDRTPYSLFVIVTALGLGLASFVSVAENGSETASTPAHMHPRMITHPHPQTPLGTPKARPCDPVLVLKGDTLYDIAKRVDRSVLYLMRRNHIRRAWLIQPGQELCTRGRVLPKGWPLRGYIYEGIPTIPHISDPQPPHAHNHPQGMPLLEQPPHGQLKVPVSPYVLSQGYVGQYPYHNGLDFAGPYGSEVRSVAAGKVIGVWWWDYSYGYHVLIQHHGGQTQYAHLANIYVHKGDLVQHGSVIGIRDTTGHSTGNHLHFEIWKNGRTVDPAPYFWVEGTGGRAPRVTRTWTGHD